MFSSGSRAALVFLVIGCLLLGGVSAMAFSGGDGSEGDPYEISNWEELNEVHNENELDDHYELINDLDSNTDGYDKLASETANDGAGWEPIGDRSTKFAGTFDGNGHEIRDLHIERAKADKFNVGLFGYTASRAEITNLGVVDAEVSGPEAVGGLVGHNKGEVTHSYSTGIVSGDDVVGGFIGHNQGEVKSSYSKGTVEGEYRLGGLIGSNDGGTVSNSYSTGNVNVSDKGEAGGLIGRNEDGTVSNSYSTVNVSAEEEAGGLGGLIGGDPLGTVENSFWDTETSGQDESAGGTGLTTDEMKNISNFEDLWDIEKIVNETTENSYPFLSWEEGGEGVWLQRQTILHLSDLDIAGQGSEAQLLVGESADVIVKVKNRHKVESQQFTLELTIDGEKQSEQTSDELEPGGTDTVEFQDQFSGLEYGQYSVTVADVDQRTRATGNVNVLSFAGGSGTEDDPYLIETWYHLDDVRYRLDSYFELRSVLDEESEGYDELATSSANGENGWKPIGDESDPFTGTFDGNGHEIRDLYIDRADEYHVGLFGYTDGGAKITNLGVVDADVRGEAGVGGLVGLNVVGKVEKSYSTGSVDGSFAGGLVGACVNSQDSTTVKDSYSTVNVSADGDTIGGLVGLIHQSRVENSYSKGEVSGGENVGGLVGFESESTVEKSFWDTETSGQDESAGGTGLTTDEMKNISTFEEDWEMEVVPANVNDYPYLAWEEGEDGTWLQKQKADQRRYSLSSGWNLFSFPGKPKNTDPEEAFGDDIDPLYMYRWDPSADEYAGGDVSSADLQLKEGASYWIYAWDDNTQVDLETAVTTSSSMNLSGKGWHMVGSSYSMKWGDVKVNGTKVRNYETSKSTYSGPLKPYIFSYDGGKREYKLAEPSNWSDLSLDKWSGCWIKTNASDVKLGFEKADSTPTDATTLGFDSQNILVEATSKDVSGPPGPPPNPSMVAEELQAVVSPTLVKDSGGITFAVKSDQPIEGLTVEVLTPSGQTIWTEETASAKLNWDAKRVANGIYLYSVSARIDGEYKQAGVGKLLVLK